jgi:hypothetical protein
MHTMTIWNRNFAPVGQIKDGNLKWLLYIGKKLQENFGAYYRIDVDPS